MLIEDGLGKAGGYAIQKFWFSICKKIKVAIQTLSEFHSRVI